MSPLAAAVALALLPQPAWAVALEVLVLNLPFGWWREGTRKLSLTWLLAVHAPVPFVVALRLASGVGFRWTTVPLLVGGYFAGQFIGGRLRRWRRARRRVARTETEADAEVRG